MNLWLSKIPDLGPDILKLREERVFYSVIAVLEVYSTTLPPQMEFSVLTAWTSVLYELRWTLDECDTRKKKHHECFLTGLALKMYGLCVTFRTNAPYVSEIHWSKSSSKDCAVLWAILTESSEMGVWRNDLIKKVYWKASMHEELKITSNYLWQCLLFAGKCLANCAAYLSANFSANRHLMAGSEYFCPQLWGQLVRRGLQCAQIMCPSSHW